MTQNEGNRESLDTEESDMSDVYGDFEYFDRESSESYKVPYFGDIVYIGKHRDCFVSIHDKKLESKHLKLSLGEYCELNVENIAKKPREEGISINGREVVKGTVYKLRQTDDFHIYQWGIRWIPSEWYVNKIETEEKAKLGEESFELTEEPEVNKTFIQTPEADREDLNYSLDLISFELQSARKTPNRLQQLEEIRSGGKSKRTPRLSLFNSRKSLLSVGSTKSHYMDPTENSIRRQRPKIRPAIAQTPNFTNFNDLTMTVKLQKLRQAAGPATPKPLKVNEKSFEAKLNDLDQVTQMLKAEIANSPVPLDVPSTPVTPPEQKIVDKMRRLTLEDSNKMKTPSPRYNLRSTAKKAKEPRYNLRSSCKKENDKIKRIATPLKKAIHCCKFDNVAYLDKKKLATPMKKELKEKVAQRPVKHKLQTPLRKAITNEAKARQVVREQQKERILKTPLKSELLGLSREMRIERQKRLIKRLLTPLKKDIKAKSEKFQEVREKRVLRKLKTPMRKELAKVSELKQEERQKRALRKLKTPMRKELAKVSLLKQEERQKRALRKLKTPMRKELAKVSELKQEERRVRAMNKKILKTPIRAEIKQVAGERQEQRRRIVSNRLATPIRAEVQKFDKTMLQKVETIIESLVAENEHPELLQEFQKAVAPTPKRLDQSLVEKMESLILDARAKKSEDEEKQALLSTLKKVFAKGLGDESKVEEYFNSLFEKGIDGVKEWMNAVVCDTKEIGSPSPEKIYYSAEESERELERKWQGKHEFFGTPQKSIEVKPIRVALEQFTDCESEKSAVSGTESESSMEESEVEETVDVVDKEEMEEEVESPIPRRVTTRRQTRSSQVMQQEETLPEKPKARRMTRRQTRASQVMEQEETLPEKPKDRRMTRRKTRASIKIVEPEPVVRPRRSTRTKKSEAEKENIPEKKKNTRRKTVASKKKPEPTAQPVRRSRRLAAK